MSSCRWRMAPMPFDVGRASLQTDDVFLCELQFGGVLDGDETLVLRNVLREDIQESRLAGARAAGDQDADAGAHGRRKHFHHFRGDALQLDQLVGCERAGAEAADRERGPVERQRRNDGVDARAVGQTRIDHRRGLVHPATHAGDDAVDDLHQVTVVAERRVGPLRECRLVR